MQTPTVAQWGLSIQHELLKNTVLTVSYIGNHGTHLYGGYDSNQVDFRSNRFLDAFKAAQAGIDTPLMTKIASGDTRNTAHLLESPTSRRTSAPFDSPSKPMMWAASRGSLANRLQSATTANWCGCLWP
jgi:hypothetical protein